MKKLLSIVLVLTIVLSLSVTAIAAETGSITITNATIGQTYNLYKFFDATYAADANGNPSLDSDGNPIVSYTMALDPTNPLFTAMLARTARPKTPTSTMTSTPTQLPRRAPLPTRILSLTSTVLHPQLSPMLRSPQQAMRSYSADFLPVTISLTEESPLP